MWIITTKKKRQIDVVGTIFLKDGKILLDKPRKRPTFQMIGGKVEESESHLEAAIRECHEEIRWFDKDFDSRLMSHALNNVIIPYCVKTGWVK